MDAIFEFLFKFRSFVFEQGELAFAAPASLRLWIGVAGVVAASAVATYTIARGRSTVVDRGVMAGLRVALLGLLVFCLLQPTLVLSTVVPQQNFVGVLIDDSRSMGLENQDGTARSDFVTEAFTPEESDLLARLQERFVLRFFRFSDVATRIDGLEELSFDGTRDITLASGEIRRWVQDGDDIYLRAHGRREGFAPIGFGDCCARMVAGAK